MFDNKKNGKAFAYFYGFCVLLSRSPSREYGGIPAAITVNNHQSVRDNVFKS